MNEVKQVSRTKKIAKIIGWTLLCLSPIYALPLVFIAYISYNELLAAVVVRPIAKEYIS